MGLQSHSQNISIKRDRVWTIVDENYDTLVIMHYEDARTLLNDVLQCEYTDSLLLEYKEMVHNNEKMIYLQKETINKLMETNDNCKLMVENLEAVIENKDKAIELQEDVIKKQKKEIRKQKIIKTVSMISAIVLPIVTLLVK